MCAMMSCLILVCVKTVSYKNRYNQRKISIVKTIVKGSKQQNGQVHLWCANPTGNEHHGAAAAAATSTMRASSTGHLPTPLRTLMTQSKYYMDQIIDHPITLSVYSPHRYNELETLLPQDKGEQASSRTSQKIQPRGGRGVNRHTFHHRHTREAKSRLQGERNTIHAQVGTTANPN